jgi:hypothetical protein
LSQYEKQDLIVALLTNKPCAYMTKEFGQVLKEKQHSLVLAIDKFMV